MGCNNSKVPVQEPHLTTYGSKSSISQLKTQTSKELNNKISSLTDFKITHSDFIVEKSGKINQEYSLLSPPIGKGAFGEVRRAIHRKTNITRAVKIIYKETTDQEEQERLINEVTILKNLDHPNIMKVLEFYQDEKHFYIVSEFYNGGELFEKITSMRFFTEKQAAITMKQILSAINYCHQHKIVHRDLKPENILFESKRDDSPIKVIDFGTSRYYEPNSKMSQKFGTPYYIAPEVLKRKYNEKCDVWSCGVIMYILLCGYPPFNGETDKIIMEKVATGKFDFNHVEWMGVSDDAKNMIKRMLELNPANRYSSEQALNDRWFKVVLGENTIDKPLAVSALTNLKHFRAERKLQEATWVFLVSQLSSREEKAQLLKTFQALDVNGDGQLSREELINGYRKILGEENAEAEVDKIMKAVDSNNSGALDYTEFVMATINRQNLLTKERLEVAFKMIDKDGSGYITIDELQELFNPGNQKMIDDNVWKELIQEVDENGDGKISYKEFKDMMMKLIG